jgi:hypothetical protein
MICRPSHANQNRGIFSKKLSGNAELNKSAQRKEAQRKEAQRKEAQRKEAQRKETREFAGT